MNPFDPPKFPRKVLRWFCKPWYVEVIEGDLLELFEREVEISPRNARMHFFINVARFFRWRYIKDIEDFQPQSSFGMFKTYFKVSVRNLFRHKLQSLFNICGLAIGIACCILILTHVKTQNKFDRHIPELESIYRVILNNGGPYTPARLVKQMRADFPEVQTGTRVSGPFEAVVKKGDRYFKQSGCMLADSTFFDVFPTEFIRGNAKEALNDPTDVVLTESVANQLFAGVDAMGQTLNSDGTDYFVSAIVADPPKTTTIPYKAIIGIPREFWATTGWWTGNNFFSYLKLKENADPAVLEAKFPQFVEKYIGPELLKFNSQYSSFEDYLAAGNTHFFSMVPMKDIHLHHSRLTMNNPGDYTNLVIFSSIAVFILIIACINYINMATARSSLRAKEIGMRKVLGSVRKLITQQFLVESFLITGVALILGILLSVLVLPYFNNISQSEYSMTDILNLQNLGWFIVLLVIAGFLSGLYPATYLASFKPLAALRGENVQGGKRKMRAVLVVVQFAISLFLMVATYIVYNQLNLMSERKLGVDAEQVYVISGADKVSDQFQAFKNSLKSQPTIEEVALSSSYPSSFMADWNYNTVEDIPQKMSPFNIFVTPELREVWGLTLQKGRFFDVELRSDTASVVVNEQFVKEVGWEDPIGQKVTRGEGEVFTVVGVIDNFVTGSARRGDYPAILRYSLMDKMYGGKFLSVRINGEVLPAIEHIESVWDEFNPGYPMEGIFMDDSFQRLYEGEERFGKLFTGFSILAIIIACMGLFTLASFILERRKKEIALRKVLGAKVSQIFYIVSVYFGKLIVIAAVIAFPIAFFLGNQWLEDYVERIEIGAITFVIPLVLLMCIALLTISYKTFKTATSNPSEALKEE
ncbi:MAG: FtsX-like permease family protein [Marinoscillum sp.]